jgi:hypothetical protein
MLGGGRGIKMFTNTQGDLEMELSTNNRLSDTVNNHMFGVEVSHNESTMKKIFIEPS